MQRLDSYISGAPISIKLFVLNPFLFKESSPALAVFPTSLAQICKIVLS